MLINDLHARVLDGDETAESQLFDKMTVSFRLFVRQRVRAEEDIKEIVQETLMTIAQKYRGMEFETSFAAWAYKILEYRLLRFYRAKSNREKVFATTTAEWTTPASTDIDPMLKVKLRDCLRELSTTRLRHARILNLNFQGYKVEDIGRKLETSTNNIYVMLSRARKLLEQCLRTGKIK